MTIRVLVATAVRLYRDGLHRILQGAEGIALVGIASTAEQTVEQACKLLPSVILLDVEMARCLALQRQFGGTPKIGGVVILEARPVFSYVQAKTQGGSMDPVEMAIGFGGAALLCLTATVLPFREALKRLERVER